MSSTVSTIGIGLIASTLGPSSAQAGIDVSGLRVEQAGNPNIADQLKSFDGSGSARVREIQEMKSSSTTPQQADSSSSLGSSTAATWAYRANPGFTPSLSRAGVLNSRCTDQVMGPAGSKRKYLTVEFEFPSDWLQLDRATGGLQYVDQRNGDKLYVLRAPLPAGETLATVSKSAVADMIFDPNGSLAKSGNTVEDYKVSSSKILSECPNQMCSIRRRFKLKYSTVTGNGLRVERRGLADAYQVDNDMYFLLTSSNAVKFEKGGIERETVEGIVDSFRLD